MAIEITFDTDSWHIFRYTFLIDSDESRNHLLRLPSIDYILNYLCDRYQAKVVFSGSNHPLISARIVFKSEELKTEFILTHL